MKPVVVRADASPQSGSGHVMRCLALAQSLAERGHGIVFACVVLTPELRQRIGGEGFEVVDLQASAGAPADAAETAALLHHRAAGCLILDGYHFDSAFCRLVAEATRRLVVFDDLADRPLPGAAVVVNAGAQAKAADYAALAPGAAVLLGPDYVVLRHEFRRHLGRELPPLADRDALLMTFGGSDPLGLGAALLPAMLKRFECAIDLVVGAEPEELVPSHGRLRLHANVNSMDELMCRAGLAVSAAGVTSGELSFMGVPSLLVVAADNQRASARRAAAMGVAVVFDARVAVPIEEIADQAAALWRDLPRRAGLAAAARALVDGRGCERICDAIEEGAP